MELEAVIVGHSQIEAAIGGGKHELVLTKTQNEFTAAAAGDQVKAGKMMIAFAGALKALRNAQTNPYILSSPAHQVAALLQSKIAEEALKTAGKVQPLPSGLGLEVRFDENDWLGWAGSFFSWAQRWIEGKFSPPPVQAVRRIKGDFDLALLADWGTGLYGAPECAKSIGKTAFDVLMHLGDVYYAGTSSEEQSRFLKYWPSIQSAQNYALNSNHEMYTGGHGYIETLLADERFKPWQSSNYFALQADHFLLVGLDTAYEEHTLTQDELAWLKTTIESAGDSKIVLFSHHQPYSVFDLDNAAGQTLSSLLVPWLSAGKIFAWYWGHEHRCILYDQHPNFKVFGRCLGHGGYPQFRKQNPGVPAKCPLKSTFLRFEGHGGPGAEVLDGPNQYIKGQETDYAPTGYMTLSFVGKEIHEQVYDPDGTPIWDNVLK